jgi:hypothetical protein
MRATCKFRIRCAEMCVQQTGVRRPDGVNPVSL